MAAGVAVDDGGTLAGRVGTTPVAHAPVTNPTISTIPLIDSFIAAFRLSVLVPLHGYGTREPMKWVKDHGIPTTSVALDRIKKAARIAADGLLAKPGGYLAVGLSMERSL